MQTLLRDSRYAVRQRVRNNWRTGSESQYFSSRNRRT